MTSCPEIPVRFDCDGRDLVGILHLPRNPSRIGVVIVTGGPQYRAGSHRQFVLLARHLAAHGYAVLRFDARGKGDSDGEFPGFEAMGPDILAAIDTITTRVPSIAEIALWGLCDAASAILLAAPGQRRVTRVGLLNPWVRTDSSLARAYLKHYYARRIVSPEFWKKLARRRFSFGAAIGSLLANVRQALIRRSNGPVASREQLPLPEKMAWSLEDFSGSVLLILSGKDFTAREFEDAVAASGRWQKLLASPRVSIRRLPEADHTFSRRIWREKVVEWTLEWLSGSTQGGTSALH